MESLLYFIGFLAFFIIISACEVYVSEEIPTPPVQIRLYGWLESLFGLLIIFTGSPIGAISHDNYKMKFLIVGVFWIFMVTQLYKSKKFARYFFIITSILRITKLWCIPFSVISLYILLVNKKSKFFFKDN